MAAAEDAVSLLEPLGPSTELAWAYAGLATQRMATTSACCAIELALRAQAIAGPLDRTEVLSDALNTQGCASARPGPVSGAGSPGPSAGDRAVRRA